MAIFSVEGSGLIQTDTLPSGDITVKHTGGGRVFDVVNGVCIGTGKGYWEASHFNWIVRKQYADAVMTAFHRLATFIE
jgi:hypothetical protein